MTFALREDRSFRRLDAVPFTKGPIRALIVGLLAPLEGRRLIEVGSGSGGVTVTLAEALGPRGELWALEPSPEAFGLTEENLRRFGLSDRVHLVAEAAPYGLTSLPTVDGAFIGGHGPHLESIVDTLWGKLLPGGRLVLSALLLDTALAALKLFEERGPTEAWNVFPARGRNLGPSWAFMGENPICLVWCDKKPQKEEQP